MGILRSLVVIAILCAMLALPAESLGGAKLPLPAASEKAAEFAENTCHRDEGCTGHGVSNCHRERARLAFCHIYIKRSTQVQGKYKCTRLIRLALIPHTRHAKVTGLGHWHC